MSVYDFTLVLDHEPSDDDLDGLFEAGCDDATPETGGRALLHFDREADSLGAALVSALADIERAGFRAQAVVSDDLVSLRNIAQRTGRTYESARLLAGGRRGPGGFPPPLSAADGWALYSWAQVSGWFAVQYKWQEVNDYDRMIAVADYLVRARAILGEDVSRPVWAQVVAS